MGGREEMKDPGKWVESIIKKFIQESPENTLKNPAREKAWDDPWWDFPAGMIPSTSSTRRDMSDPFTGCLWRCFKWPFPSRKRKPRN